MLRQPSRKRPRSLRTPKRARLRSRGPSAAPAETRSAPVQRPKCCASLAESSAPRNALGSGSEAQVLRQPAESGCQQRAAHPETRSAPVQRPKCCASQQKAAAELAHPETRSAPVQRPKCCASLAESSAPRNALGSGSEAQVLRQSAESGRGARAPQTRSASVQRPKCCASQQKAAAELAHPETRSAPVQRPKCCASLAESSASRNALGSGKQRTPKRARLRFRGPSAAPASRKRLSAESSAPRNALGSGPEAQVLRQPAESGRGACAPRNALRSGPEAQVLRQPSRKQRTPKRARLRSRGPSAAPA